MKRPVRILGIDPGTAIVGWGVIDADGSQIHHVAHGCITTPKESADAQRLEEIARDLAVIIAEYTPQLAAVERIFYAKNQTTVIGVAQARGVILAELARANIAIGEYSPPQVKQAVTGHGRADKKQVQEMVRALCGLARYPQPDDAADALAVAICHSASYRMPRCSGV